MERKIRSFRAMRPNKEIVLVDEYQEFIETGDLSTPHKAWMPGLKRFELQDGGMVNYVDETTYKIVSSGELISTKG